VLIAPRVGSNVAAAFMAAAHPSCASRRLKPQSSESSLTSRFFALFFTAVHGRNMTTCSVAWHGVLLVEQPLG
jgi:hypothetical protein